MTKLPTGVVKEILRATRKNVLKEYARFMKNKKTRVWINHNNEAGLWQWSVQVAGTDFWLDSFKTRREAEKFIRDNNLQKNM